MASSFQRQTIAVIAVVLATESDACQLRICSSGAAGQDSLLLLLLLLLVLLQQVIQHMLLHSGQWRMGIGNKNW